MYENMTFENIMARCMARISASLDKREGSIMYDAVAPAAAELAVLYIELAYLLDRAFPDTETGEDLTKKCRERSVFRVAATCAVRKAILTKADGSGCNVPIGTRFSGGDLNFAVAEKITSSEYRVTAETPGAAGNEYIGTLFPIDYVPDLAAATLSDILIPGEDEESDEALRERYFASLESQAYGGNIADYKAKVELLPGVGKVKVIPVWNGDIRPAELIPPEGTESWMTSVEAADAIKAWLAKVYAAAADGKLTVGGAVRIVLVDSEWSVPSAELVAEVQEAVDPVGMQGEGVGVAPIGHVVTVAGVTGKTIDITFVLTFSEPASWSTAQTAVKAAIQSYFDGLTQTWADNDSLIVRVSQIETAILNVEGIIDIQGTTINGGTANIPLSAEEIPVLGEVTNGA